MSAERSLVLLFNIERARRVCASVAEDTGGLLSDDPCMTELREAEAALTRHDEIHGLRRRRRYIGDAGDYRRHRRMA